MIYGQSKKQILDFAAKIYDENFVKECMASRTVEVKPYLEDDSIPQFEVKTSKIYKPDYVSCTVRSQDDFDQLIQHINQLYGGLIIPVLAEVDPEGQPDETAQSYEIYLNALLQNKQIRNDSILFAFFFLEQHKSPYRSSYQRFLTNAIELSRKHISQLFTRQDTEQVIKFDKELEQYRQIILQKKKKYEQIQQLIDSKCQEHQHISEIFVSILPGARVVDKELGTYFLRQRINTFFKEIQGAYQRRIVLKEHIKQLKAESIRHKYNPKHESTEELLQKQRHKHQIWNETLLKQIECNIVILDSLIKEVVLNYLTIQKLNYENQKQP